MIQARNLTKRYGDRTALDDVSFDVRAGLVTGFLGPNGAGKSTTMRLIVGLDRATSGDVTVNGRHYGDHRAPLREVGVLLDAKAVHRGRSAFEHLRAMGATTGVGKKRVEEVIAFTGLESVAKKRVGGFSLGMGQRLGIAAALLGDPATLILDEPVNGLDPEGVVWVRNLARQLAGEGRTVFLSSHLMSEMAQTADHIIVLGVAHHTPEGVDDRTASTLAIAGSTAAAALAVLNLGPDDTVLVGGAGGGVGVFVVQLARIAGARVIGTGSPATADYLRSLGAEPVAYGEGLADRVRALDGGPVTAALDLHDTDTVGVARDLGVADGRICTIAAVVEGVPAANGATAGAAALQNIARLIADGRLRVPIAATFPVNDVRAAVKLQAGRHVRGKVVVDL